MIDREILDQFELSVRTYRVLMNMDVDSLDEVRLKKDRELLREPSCGKVTLKEIREVIGPHFSIEKSLSDPLYKKIEILKNKIKNMETQIDHMKGEKYLLVEQNNYDYARMSDVIKKERKYSAALKEIQKICASEGAEKYPERAIVDCLFEASKALNPEDFE
jgi:ubiquinone/menaquinone biosynthesis C-methylase UbiE